MRDYIEERALEIGEYIIEEGATVSVGCQQVRASYSGRTCDEREICTYGRPDAKAKQVKKLVKRL